MDRQPAEGVDSGSTDLSPSGHDGARLRLGKAAQLMKAAGQAGMGDDDLGDEAKNAAMATDSLAKEELEDDYWQRFVGQDGPSQVSKMEDGHSKVGTL